ncbi:helix-turn-helix transcriptional regulator [Paenarthrobacter nitroguajacolicus]
MAIADRQHDSANWAPDFDPGDCHVYCRPLNTPLLDSLVTPDALAERPGVTRRTVDGWRITGKGPKFIPLGRVPRYGPEAVDAWLLSQERASTSEEMR